MAFRNAPALRFWVHGVRMVERYYRSTLRLLSVARREGKSASVKAICDDTETADLWADRWSAHGVLVERLVGSTCFFELTAAQLQRLPDLPRARPDTPGAAGIILRPN